MQAIATFLALILAPSFAMSLAPARYSQMLQRFFPGRSVQKSVVYMGPEVKKPGAYKFKNGMTAAALIKLAGGLKKAPEAYAGETKPQFPKLILIYRPTKRDPDPDRPIYQCKLDWKLPDAGTAECTFALNRNDLLIATTVDKFPL